MSYARRILAIDPAAVFEIVGEDVFENIVFHSAPIARAALDAVNLAALDASEAARRELVQLDLASIRAMREYIAAKPDAPQILKDREAAAVAARAQL